MIRLLLICSALAMQEPAPPPGADEATKAAPEAEVRARALAKYNEMRGKTPMTAAAQSRLATWCEENGLAAESYVHLSNVIRLDPRRDAAWRKLGFKKHDGRWMTDEQVAEEAELRTAAAAWAKKFKDWHKQVHGGRKQAEARAALDEVTDPKAVPTIYREFGVGGEVDQLIAVQLLGQIDSPLSSKTLAALAIYGKSPEVRRRALETLRRRPAEDFLGLFVALMRDPLKYEVRPVGGPGSPGVLFVEGEQFNVQRFYVPPPPNLTPRPGDMIGYGANGAPAITRTFRGTASGVPGSKSLVTEKDQIIQYSIPQAMLQAQQAALVAQGQLANDVAQVESINDERNRFNELVMIAAKSACGKDPGKTPKHWRDMLSAKVDKYAKRPTRSAPKPTLSELVPIAFTYTISAQAGFLTRTYVDT